MIHIALPSNATYKLNKVGNIYNWMKKATWLEYEEGDDYDDDFLCD